jgi:hypothetical protein
MPVKSRHFLFMDNEVGKIGVISFSMEWQPYSFARICRKIIYNGKYAGQNIDR